MLAYQDERFMQSEHGRPVRIMSEFLASKALIEDSGIDHTIVIFGSARLPENDRYYKSARELAAKFGEWAKKQPSKYAICTGGGPGIMEAGNRGAKEAGAPSLGFCIELPYEQETNPYVDKNLEQIFHYFFLRKFWFLSKSNAIVVFPGGYGTCDELFEALTMIQNKKSKNVPFVFFGEEFWKKLVNWQMFLDYKLIDKEDLDLFKFTDSVDFAFDYIVQNMK